MWPRRCVCNPVTDNPRSDAPEKYQLDALASIGRGTAAMVVGSVLFLIFNFLGRVAVARLVSVSAWGLFNLGLALTGFLALIALLGLHQATARTISYETDPYVRQQIIRRALAITSIDAIVFSAVVFFLAHPLAAIFASGATGELTLVFQMFSVTIGFTLLSSYLAALFQGFERAGPNAWFNQTLNPGIFLVFLVLLFAFHLGFLGALIAYVVASGAAFAALLAYTLTRIPELLPKLPPRTVAPPPKVPREFWRLTVSFWGVNALGFVTTFIDTLILGVYRPASQVGLYSAATTFARLFLVGNTALAYVYLPVTARLQREGSYGTIQWTYVTATRWVVALGFPLLLLFVFLPSQSLAEVFGPGYQNAALALPVLVVAAFVSNALGPVTATLAGLGRGYVLNAISLVSASLNVGLSFLLIPGTGLLGAAVAWSVSRVVFTGLGAIVLYRSHQIVSFRRGLLLPTLVALGSGVPLFVLFDLLRVPGWTIYPLFVIGLAVFLGAMLVTRNINRGDLLAVRAAEKLLGRPLPLLRRFLERFVALDFTAPV